MVIVCVLLLLLLLFLRMDYFVVDACSKVLLLLSKYLCLIKQIHAQSLVSTQLQCLPGPQAHNVTLAFVGSVPLGHTLTRSDAFSLKTLLFCLNKLNWSTQEEDVRKIPVHCYLQIGQVSSL